MGILLYEMEASPPCAAVLMTLEHLGIKIDRKCLDYSSGEHLKPEFSKINPQRIVPTINDDGFILWESRAILEYLVEKYAAGSPLYPKDVKERATINKMLYFDIGILYTAASDYMFPIFFHGKSPDPAKKKALEKALGFLEGFLSKTSYVAGNHLTIADFSILASTSFIFLFGYSNASFPKITAWMNKMKSNVPGYKDIVETPLTTMKESINCKEKI